MSEDTRTLHRFVPRERYADPLPDEYATGLFVDCETTGLDTATDQIIELGLLPFLFDREGTVYNVGPGVNYFNDPGVPIPPEITALTGITDDTVRGQSIDMDHVSALVLSASLVIAHHAEFDRQILERLSRVFVPTRWACSYREVDWQGMFNAPCSKLAHLLIETCDEFYEPHRALTDCEVGLHVLATATHEGRTALSYLLESARQRSVRVSAVGAPFEVKDALKARKYFWNPTAKVWYRDVRQGEVEAEFLWLNEHARCHRPTGYVFDSRDRYSERVR